MTNIDRAGDRERRRAALEWLAREQGWEDRLERLRRPGGGRPARKRTPRPDTGLRRAG